MTPSPEAAAAERVSGFVEDWRELATHGHATGPMDADVVIVQFADFQCPACRNFNRTLAEVRDSADYSLRVVYRHMPLSGIHPFAAAAAVASECAGEQGRFVEYAGFLYENQRLIPLAGWGEWAETVGVADPVAFQDCLTSDKPLQRLAADSSAVARLGVSATPTLVVNGRVYEGAPSPGVLREVLRRAVADIR